MKKKSIVVSLSKLVIQSIFLISCSKVNMDTSLNTNTKNESLFYQIHGDGAKPIVFLHGMFGSHSYWDGILPSLKDGHQLVLLDLLGFGASPKPHLEYTVIDHLNKIDETISKTVLQGAQFTLVGHSMGALIALDYAIAHPQRIKKLVLINAPLVTNEQSLKKAIAESSSKVMAAMTFNKQLGMLVCMMHEIMPTLSYPIIRWLEPDLPAAVARDVGHHTWDSFSGSFKNILLNQNFYNLLDQVSAIPVLILVSSNDKYASDADIEKLPDRKNLKVIKIEGGHNVLLQDPKKVTVEILKFID